MYAEEKKKKFVPFQMQEHASVKRKKINKTLQEKYVIRNDNQKHQSDQSSVTVDTLFGNTMERFCSTEQTEVDYTNYNERLQML